MKVTELNEELIEEIKSTSLYLIRAINSYRNNKDHKFTHTKIGANMSTPISQSTVSKMLSEANVDESENPYSNLSISEAKELCTANHGLNIGSLMSFVRLSFSENRQAGYMVVSCPGILWHCSGISLSTFTAKYS